MCLHGGRRQRGSRLTQADILSSWQLQLAAAAHCEYYFIIFFGREHTHKRPNDRPYYVPSNGVGASALAIGEQSTMALKRNNVKFYSFAVCVCVGAS